MQDNLSAAELMQLVRTVFSLRATDKHLAILVDVPDDKNPDQPAWRARRLLARQWWQILNQNRSNLGLRAVRLFYYPNIHSHNAELPQFCYESDSDPTDLTTEILTTRHSSQDFTAQLAQKQIILAPTQFSTTAPLMLLARQFSFRAATMPGFSTAMIPALRLDWQEINRRVDQIKHLLDLAKSAEIEFIIDRRTSYQLNLDLRFRTAHTSSGLLPEPGTVGNLPSGESYIVPYEGEKGEFSRSEGILPVQFDNEVVLYRVEKNAAVDVISSGMMAQNELAKLRDEPAYGNLAELGFGVLRPFSIQPIGELLLDEKLGLHIAFGRSDHFGGAVGVRQFRQPENVIHLDHIFIPEIQPRIGICLVALTDAKQFTTKIIENDVYCVF